MKNKTKRINLLKNAFEKLNSKGFDNNYIYKYGLPSWWNKKLNYTFSGYMEAIAIISDRFNIKPETLLYDEKEIKFKTPKQKTNDR